MKHFSVLALFLIVSLNIFGVKINGLINGTIYACEENKYSVNLSIVNSSYFHTYKWYKDKELKNELNTGATFTYTPSQESEEMYVIDESYPDDTTVVKIVKHGKITAQIDDIGGKKLCNKQSIELKANVSAADNSTDTGEAFTYTWYKDATPIATGATFNAKEQGNYSAEITHQGCTVKTNTVVVPQPTKVKIGGLEDLCTGGSISLTASGMKSYQWGSDGDYSGKGDKYEITAAGNYSVIGEDGTCKDTFDFQINIKENIKVRIEGATAFCPGSDNQTTLTAIVEGSTADKYTYSWKKKGKGTPISKDQSIEVNELTEYTVDVTEIGQECSGHTSVIVSETAPVGTIQLEPQEVLICSGHDAQVKVSGTNLTKFEWSYDGKVIETSAKAIQISKGGEYTVIGYSDQQCPSEPFKFEAKEVKTPLVIVEKVYPCEGDTVTITAKCEEDLEFWWDDIESNEKTRTISEPNKYTANVYDPKTGCSSKSISDINFPSYPTILGEDITICQGDKSAKLMVGATNGEEDTYQWSNQDGEIIKTNSLFLTDLKAGTYTFSAENSHGCKKSESFTVKEIPVPTATISKDKDYICSSDEEITLTASGEDIAEYSWSKGQQQESGATLKVKEAGTYTLTIIGENGCKNNQSVSVESKSVIDVKKEIPTICEGSIGRISVSAAKPCEYLWEKDQSTNNYLDVNKGGIYDVMVTDKEFGCTQRISLKVKLTEVPSISIMPKEKSVCQGETVTILANVHNIGHSCDYLWNNNITTNRFTTDTAGVYKVIVTDSKTGCQSEAESKIRVNPLPTIQITSDQDSVCNGESISLTASGADSYAWKEDLIRIPSQYSNITRTLTQTKTYQVIGTNKETGCQSSPTEKTIVVSDPFEIAVVGELTTCEGRPFSPLKAEDADYFEWFDNKGQLATGSEYTPEKAGVYRVVGKKSNNACLSSTSIETKVEKQLQIVIPQDTFYCAGRSVTLFPQGAFEYEWINPEGKTEKSSSYTISSPGTYKVTGYSKMGCKSQTQSVRVEEKENPTVTIEGDSILCTGESVKLKAIVKEAANSIDYQWNIPMEDASKSEITLKEGGTYTVQVMNPYGCLAHAEKTLKEKHPTVSIEGVSQFCEGDSVKLAAKGDAISYYWNGGSVNQTEITVHQTSVIQLTGKDQYGCTTTTTHTIYERRKPVLDVKDTVFYCEHSSFDIIVSMDSTPTGFAWNKAGIAPTASFKVQSEGVVSVTGYDEWNCPSETRNIVVKETKVPVVKIEGINYICPNGDSVSLTAQVEGAYDGFRWNTGDTKQNIQVGEGGIFEVKAFIGSCASESDTFSVEQKLAPQVTITEGESKAFCNLLSVTLHAESPTAQSFRWEPTGSDSSTTEVNFEGVSTVYVEDQYGCKNHAEITTYPVEGPRMEIKGDTALCEFAMTALQLECPDCVSQEWNTGEKGRAITIYESGTYTVEAIGSNGCPNKAEHHIEITPAPSLRIEGETNITSNDSTLLTAVAEGSEPFRFYWTPNHETGQSILVRANEISQIQNYTVMVYDRNNCYNFESATITQHTVKLNGEKEFCEGDSTVLTAVGDGISQIKWSTGATSPNITIKNAGLYSIITWHENGLIDTIRFEITVHPLPEISIQGDLSFCQGDSSFLSVTGEYTDRWWGEGIHTDSVIVREAGIYTATAVNEFGCTKQDSVEVISFNLPNVLIIGPDSIIEGESIQLHGEGAITYHWSSPDTTTESITLYEGGTYNVVGIDAHNCRQSAIHDVRVIPIPHPLINDTTNGHAIACVDEKVLLVASGAERYTWDTRDTSDSIYVTESRIYTVTGCLNNGQCKETHFSVEFSPHPRMMSIDGFAKVCPDSSTIFTAHTYDDDLITHFVWSTGENTQSISVRDSQSYSVHAVSKYGCLSDTLSKTLSYHPVPKPTIEGPREICEGSSIELYAKGGRKYRWIESGEENESIVVASAGKQTIRAWNEFGCASDTSVYIENRGVPQINIVGEKGICEGDSTQLSVSGIEFAENHYLWNTGDTTSTITVKQAGIYSVALTNRTGCFVSDTSSVEVYKRPIIEIKGNNYVCIDDSIRLVNHQITQNKIEKYLWNTGGTDSMEHVKSAGVFTLEVIDEHACKSNTASHTVEIKIPNPIILSGDFDICNNQEDSAHVQARCEGGIFFSWLHKGDTISYGNAEVQITQRGKYMVVSTDAFGCRSHQEVEIVGHDAPSLKITGAENPVCGVETTTLCVVSDANLTNYNWNTGETSSSIMIGQSGSYRVEVTDRFGCKNREEANLVLNDIPGMALEGNLGFCPNEGTDITAVGAETYLWSNGSNESLVNIHEAGTYSVIGTDQYGCEKQIDFHVSEYYVPNVLIAESPSQISRKDPTVEFTATTADPIDNCYFVWSMGDGNEVNDRSFSYTFNISKQRWFNVVLSVQTTEGCAYSREVTLPVILDIPNTITPNGDDINDIFMKGFNVEIFDRHGTRVFMGNDGWDGHLKDDSVVADTYYYVLTDVTGEIYRGYLTVRK